MSRFIVFPVKSLKSAMSLSPPGRYERVAQWTSERDSEMALHGPQGLHLLPLLPEVRIKLHQWLREKKKWEWPCGQSSQSR